MGHHKSENLNEIENMPYFLAIGGLLKKRKGIIARVTSPLKRILHETLW
jgi:hypothetical protein